MLLSECKKGIYTIKEFACNKKLQDRFEVMGLYEGCDVEVISNEKYFPLQIKIKGANISIGRGMCDKVIVR